MASSGNSSSTGLILYDMGLVELETPVPEFNDKIQPICLPYGNKDMREEDTLVTR